MDGIIFTDTFTGGSADLVNSISKFGYNDTPLFSRIRKAVPKKDAQVANGHAWQYEEAPDGDADNAHVEGGAEAAATSEELGDSLNHYQIIKHTYGTTGSQEGVNRRDGDNEFKRQGTLKSIKHRKTKEKLILSKQAPIKRVGKVTAGRSGGLWHWAGAHNTIDTAGDFTIKKLKEMLKIAYFKGVPITHLVMNDHQKDILDDWYEAKIRVNMGTKVVQADNTEMIKNLMYAPNLSIIVSPEMADDEILGLSMNELALVYHRLTFTKDSPSSDDETKKQIISELTLRVNNPYAVTAMTGLSV